MNEPDSWADTTADNPWNKQKIKKINTRIKKEFKNLRWTHYWISVNYYEPTQGYNLFFNSKRRRIYQRSVPIAELPHCSFENLVKVLKGIRQTYNFTFKYRLLTEPELKILRKEVH